MVKRTIQSAVLATLGLGSVFAPVTMAATKASSTTTTTQYTITKHDIIFNGKTVSNPYGIAANDPNTHHLTTFMPLFYVMQALKALGVTYTWDGQHLNVLPGNGMTPDLTNLKPGSEPLQLAINGTLVQTGPKLVMKDPYSHVNSTYVPIFYIKDLLTRLGVQSQWDGSNWTLTYNATGTVALTASQSTIGTGTADALTLAVTDKSGHPMQVSPSDVQWTVNDATDGFVNPNSDQFFATKAGSYQITASYKGVTSAPVTINVFGDAAKIDIAASGPVVANGKSAQTINLTALDANGNIAAKENGSVTVTDTAGWLVTGNSNGVNTTGKSVTAVFKNGSAQVQIQAPLTPGLSDTLTTAQLTDVQSGVNMNYGSVTVNSVAQQATSLQISPVNGQKYLVANGSTSTAQFDVTVLDQGGQPMTVGTYPYNITVSGPANYNGASTGLYVGGTNPLPITVTSQQGATGQVTVSVSGNNLQSASATVQAVIAQAPSKLSATSASDSTSFTEGSTLTLNLAGMDQNGYPTSFPTTPLVAYITNASGSPATNIKVNGQSESSAGFALGGNQSLSIADDTTGADAGSYSLTIKDASGNVWLTQPLTETATAATKLSLTPASNEVAEANPTTQLTLQYTDVYGNPVTPQQGSTVTVTAPNSTGTATLNGQDATKGVSVTPDANGQAILQFTPQSPAGTTWTLSATANGVTSNTATVSVMNSLVSASTISMTDTANNSPTQAQAGDSLKFTFGALDTYGNVYSGNDQFTVSFPADALLGVSGSTKNGITSITDTLTNLNNKDFASVRVGAAQALQVTITDSNVSSARPGTAQMKVIPAGFSQFAFFNSANQLISPSNPLSVQANTPVEVWLRPVDAFGNPVSTATTTDTVDLLDNGSNGYFRSTPSSANELQVQFPIGTSGLPVYYVNSATTNVALQADISSTQSTQNCSVQMGAFTKYNGTGTTGSGLLTVTLKDQDKVPVTGHAAQLTARASASGVTVGAFTETSPGVYQATVTSTTNNTGVTVTVTDGTLTVGTSTSFDS